MHKVCFVFEQLIDAFYDVSLAQHELVPQGHKFVFHVRPESVNEVDTLVEEVLKEILLDVAFVGKHFAVEHLCEDRPYPFVPVIDVGWCETEGHYVIHVVAQ